jgi:GNAT superfamily N-acetyltransferase
VSTVDAIRKATAQDAAASSALIDGLAPYPLADPSEREAAAPFFATVTPGAVEGAISGGRFIYHLADAGCALVGAVGVRDGSHVYHLFVAEGFQRGGRGGALWRVARGYAEGAGGGERFTVNASLSAVPVYARLGFVPSTPVTQTHGLAFVPMALERAKGSRP